MMLANITVPLLGLVDTAVLGHLEHSGYLAGVAIGSNIFTCLFWAFGFLRMGTTGLIAQAYGKQDQTQILRTLLQSIGLALFIGLVIIANQIWVIPIAIALMDGSEQAQTLATTYCHIRIWGAPATLIQYVLIGTYIGLQKPRASLMILVCINVLNIIFDLWFVVLMKWDVMGVALATILAEYLGVILSIGYLGWHLRSSQPKLLALTTSSLKKLINRAELSHLFRVNSDIFIRTCCLLFAFAFFTAQGAKQGDVILAANAVLLTFLLLISNTLDGFANAAEAMVGKIIGQKLPSTTQLNTFVRAILQWCLGFAGLLTVVFYAFGPSIISLLTNIEAVALTANQYLYWLVLMPGFACLSYLYDGVFVGATETRAMRNIMVICLLLVFLPLWAITQPYGNHGLWFALSAFMISRSFFMYASYRRFLRQLIT